MSDDLSEIRDRIRWCRDEIFTLAGEMNAFLSEAITHRIEYDVSQPAYSIFVAQKKPIPVSIRSRIGTITNELRSCLDELACRLAIRNGKDPKDVYFPISKSKEIFEGDGMRKIRKLSQPDQAIIIALKPYREASPMLFGLHEADRTRKHQRLIACVGQHSEADLGQIFKMSGSARLEIGQMIVGNKVVATNFSYDSKEVDLSQVGKKFLLARNVPTAIPLRLKYRICYLEPIEIEGVDVPKTLELFADTADSIVANF